MLKEFSAFNNTTHNRLTYYLRPARLDSENENPIHEHTVWHGASVYLQLNNPSSIHSFMNEQIANPRY